MKKVIISTDCVADFPSDIRKKMEIPVMPYFISTERARYLDVYEMDSEVLLQYIDYHDAPPKTSCPSEEEYRNFFEKLQRESPAGIIHIGMAKNMTGAYRHAKLASMDMENVHVVDSGAISGAIAILVLYAADMARRGCSTLEILDAIEKKKKKLVSSFVVRDLDFMIRGGKMDEKTGKLAKFFHLQPVFRVESSRLVLKDYFLGGEKHYAKNYINYILRNHETIDPAILFITTTGCTGEFKQWLYDEASRKIKWDKIIMQTNCAAISCNWGPGAFGFLFARK